jgi:RNA polymerase sigma factor (sigma-70 family)
MATASDPRTDPELLQAWRGGDAEAGKQLFSRHATAVTNLFRRNVRNADVIPDLVQDTFIACRTSTTQDIANVGAWLRGVAYFKMTHYFRTERNAPRLGADEEAATTLESLEPDPEYLLQISDERRLLMKALRRIKIEYQAIIELNYWEGVSCDDIAEILGLPQGTVRRRLQLGRDALEAQLEKLAESKALLETTTMSITDWKQKVQAWIAEHKA